MIDAEAICQTYEKQEMATIEYVRCENNPANSLTNVKHSDP